MIKMPDDTPIGMKLLTVGAKGYPVPWFVDKRAPFKDGDYDFRIMDGIRLKTAIKEHRCWVCGLRIVRERGTFVAGPMCGVNRTSAEPPCHLACARISVQTCPFLKHPGRIRDDSGLPEGARAAGVTIARNPGVSMLWTSGYSTWQPSDGGLLFEMGEPMAVEWWRLGRAATRAEVEESVNSGIPLLRERCFTQEDHRALDEYRERFQQYLPSA